MWTETTSGLRRALTAAACAGLGLAAAAGSAGAQEEDGAVPRPRVPAGVRLAVLPVQAVAPAPSGAWPGGASSRSDARDRMNAELDFALSSSRDASSWSGPRALTRLVERNPMIDADPHRLAVGRLADVDPGEGQLREPLHRQLRRLSALADVRIAVIPLRLTWRPPEQVEESGGEDGEGGEDEAGAAPPDSGRPSVAVPGRTVLEVAVVDTRAARMLWRGEVLAAPSEPDAPGSLATLASNLVRLLSP